MRWHIAHVRTSRATECARCYDPIIAEPGLHASTDDDRLICDHCAQRADAFRFVRLVEYRFDLAVREAAR
jgi:hypothetical protein